MECSICMLPMPLGTYIETLCGHKFHKNCLCNWFNIKKNQKATCPLCRSDIKYDRGITTFWDQNKKHIKKTEYAREEIFFYKNGKRRYLLNINRNRNNDDKILGGIIYGKFRFDRNLILNDTLINNNLFEIQKMRLDENYDILDEIHL